MNIDIIINIIIILVYEYDYKDIITRIRVHLSLFLRILSK